MDLVNYLKGLKRRAKSDDIPGTVEAYLERECPACGKGLKHMKPCCGSPKGVIQCRANCGYKEQL